MPAENKNRILYIYKYLWEHTDENHTATINELFWEWQIRKQLDGCICKIVNTINNCSRMEEGTLESSPED